MMSAAGTALDYDRYFIRDHLGSVAVLTDCSGNVVEHDSYDPWGKRRNANGTDDAGGSLISETSKGFTGHEQLDMLGLVNMSARVYDPLTGRFMSPDPVIQNLTNLQDLNPYSYVDNNPLSVTDPTGMCKGFFGCVVSFLPEIAAIAVAIYAPYALAGVEAGLEGTTAATATAEFGVANAIVAGAAAGAISSGGNWQDTLISAATAGAFYEVGTATGAVGQSGQALTSGGTALQQWAESPQFLEDVAGHGLVGGLASIAGGGNFQSGFLAAGFSSAAGPGLAIAGPGYDNVLSESVTGGVGSVLGGGKFGSGALTGAFSYLFRGGVQAPGSNGNQGGLYGIPVIGQIAQGVNWVGNQVEEAFSATIGGTQSFFDNFGGNSKYNTSLDGQKFAQNVVWGHGDRHVVDPLGAQEEILNSLPPMDTIGGPFWGRTENYEYRAFPLPNGSLNIGTYYPKP